MTVSFKVFDISRGVREGEPIVERMLEWLEHETTCYKECYIKISVEVPDEEKIKQ
jgi:hypothetical protein